VFSLGVSLFRLKAEPKQDQFSVFYRVLNRKNKAEITAILNSAISEQDQRDFLAKMLEPDPALRLTFNQLLALLHLPQINKNC
jgi:hypothetical protein